VPRRAVSGAPFPVRCCRIKSARVLHEELTAIAGCARFGGRAPARIGVCLHATECCPFMVRRRDSPTTILHVLPRNPRAVQSLLQRRIRDPKTSAPRTDACNSRHRRTPSGDRQSSGSSAQRPCWPSRDRPHWRRVQQEVRPRGGTGQLAQSDAAP
jgi:hypothetical protein